MAVMKSVMRAPNAPDGENARQVRGRVTLAKLNTINLDSDPSVVVDVSFDGISEILYGSRSHWESRPEFVPSEGQLVVWTDHGTATDGQGNEVNVPGFKVGDGNAYNLDLPFVGEDVSSFIENALSSHVGNASIHVSSEDRLNWNSKVDVSDTVENETLLFIR